MTVRETEVAIIGGGAAGIAAARRLTEAGVDCLILEARGRLGGRAFTVVDPSGDALDIGCGWLHSADRNPWVPIAVAQGRGLDKTQPPWERPALTLNFPRDEQEDFQRALTGVFEALGPAVADGRDRPVSDLLPPNGPWNPLLNAIAGYIGGTEFDRMSALDFDRYEDSEINWRLTEGYGAMIAAHGEGLAVAFDCPVKRIDHSGKRLKIETAKGDILADRAIVTLPTNVLAEREDFFFPALPDKMRAARGLPLGLDDKLFLALDGTEEFETESRVFGHTDTSRTGLYHIRPFGRPMIEVFLAGSLVRDLQADGERAYFDFAVGELTGVFGNDFARRLKLLHIHPWGTDPFARGAYSCAVPGAADERAVLAATVEGRLYFAGEACSRHDFSTAHGAYNTGRAAADSIITARR